MGLSDGLPSFRPRFPWFGPDLQTLRNILQPPQPVLPGPAETLHLPTSDGSGDVLTALYHRQPDGAARPGVLLIHGLTGCADSPYMKVTAAHLLRLGYPVVRLNLRGAGSPRQTCRLHYHGGRTEDIAAALAGLPTALTQAGLLAVGYSLGGNLLLKYLGEHRGDAAIRAGVAVSAPIDLGAASRRLRAPRNRLYETYLIGRMQAEDTAPNAAITPVERATILASRTIVDYDDGFVGPKNGFAGADDYYRSCSSNRFMPAITVPTLVLHAINDPWIPREVYAGFDWKKAPALTPVLSKGGGHLGFHSGGHAVPWHDRCIETFFARH